MIKTSVYLDESQKARLDEVSVLSGRSQADLIREAAAYLNPIEIAGRLFGNVAAIAETPDGRRFPGVCIDTPCGTGFCAEAAAIGAMVTAGEQRIARIVAVWRDPGTGRLHVLPPCGRCRLFVSQVHPDNLHRTRVILGDHEATALADLSPSHEWPAPLDAAF